MDSERMVSRPIRPLKVFSMGCVTRTSTCSVESPGASVWTITVLGENSGKISRPARERS
jgi:hypothetical protein